METTALVTFLIGSIHGTGTVDLWGSWDNFSTPWPMQKDRQKGHGHWFGTHTFKNIICDGDPSERMDARNGALKMGSRYWYYYQRDGHTDFHDPTEAFVNDCPLLPGQTVNILDVPFDLDKTFSAMFTSSGERLPVTMNPADRYIQPTPRPKRNSSLKTIPALPKGNNDDELVISHKHSKIRQDWMFRQLGRLHTAVTDLCLSTYAGHSPPPFGCTRRQQVEAQRRHTAPGAIGRNGPCDKVRPKAASTAPKYPERNASLGRARPRSRVGLLLAIEENALEEEKEDPDAAEDEDDRLTNPFLTRSRSLRLRRSYRFSWSLAARPATLTVDDEAERYTRTRQLHLEIESKRPLSVPPRLIDAGDRNSIGEDDLQSLEWGQSQRGSVTTPLSRFHSFKSSRSLSTKSTRTLSLRRRKPQKSVFPARSASLRSTWTEEQLDFEGLESAPPSFLSLPPAITDEDEDQDDWGTDMSPAMPSRAPPPPPPAPEPPSWGSDSYPCHSLPPLMTSFSARQDDRSLSNYSDMDSHDGPSSSWTPLTDSPILDNKMAVGDRVIDWSSTLLDEMISPSSSTDSVPFNAFSSPMEGNTQQPFHYENLEDCRHLRPGHHHKARTTGIGTLSGFGSQETIRASVKSHSDDASPHLGNNFQFDDSMIERFTEDFTRNLRLAMPDMSDLQETPSTMMPELSSPIGDFEYLSEAISY